jgi:ankyrin repeat protein
MLTLRADEPLAIATTGAIQSGNLDELEQLLTEHPELANSRITRRDACGEQSRSLLHIATDWPGHFPDVTATVRLLIAARADVNARFAGAHGETPLHWAASSDDVDVADVLMDAGADLDVLGGSIVGGTPLDNAVGYGCWHVARRLVERGARVDRLWHAAALGMLARLDELLAANPPPTTEDINNAFWQACHGGQRRAAERLLERGADVNWTPDYAEGTGLDVAGGLDTRRDLLVTWLGQRGGEHASEADRQTEPPPSE